MNNRTNDVLTDLGLEEREIKAYLALIKNKGLTAFQISKEIRIDRTTMYDILERLIDKGIVSYSIVNKIKCYSALNPEELLTYFKEKYSSLKTILPELNRITQQSQEKVGCELFQGRDGLKTILKDLIDQGKDYKVIGIRKEYEEILGFFNEQGILRLNGFDAREIAIVEKGARFKRLKNGRYKYLNKKLLSPVTTLIYGNKVVFFIWVEPYFAVSVESSAFVKAQAEYFDLLWKFAR